MMRHLLSIAELDRDGMERVLARGRSFCPPVFVQTLLPRITICTSRTTVPVHSNNSEPGGCCDITRG